METWVSLDKSRHDLKSRNHCKFKWQVVSVGFILTVVMVACIKPKTPTVTVHVSSTSLNGSERDRGVNGGLSDEKYQGTKKLPHALLIGAKKAGTRALLEFIRVHPNVRAAGHEIHYFDRNYSLGPEWYRNMMPTSIHQQITIEKTPSYLVTVEAPQRVYNMNKKMKIILVLKDPVERAISDFTQSRLKVKNPAYELKKLQEFLNLKTVITDDHFYFNSTKGFPCLKKREASGIPHCLGEGKGRVHPKISTYAKLALYDFYKPYNAELYEMVGIDFKWEKRKPRLTTEPVQ